MIKYLLIALALISCTKKSNSFKASSVPPTDQTIEIPTCGTITMTPDNLLYTPTVINFQAELPDGDIQDLQWVFKKADKTIYSASSNPVSHVFNGPSEGYGPYTAQLTFKKGDGNLCALEKSFQILQNDICAKPSGISGPLIGYVNDELEFSVNTEPCFQGSLKWDMNGDNIVDFTTSPNESVKYTFHQPGMDVIKVSVIDFNDDEGKSLTHTIEIRNKNCINPFTNLPVEHGKSIKFSKKSDQCGQGICESVDRMCNNGNFVGDETFTEDPATCPVSAPCPATYAWVASDFGKCTGACDAANGTQSITNYICKRTLHGTTLSVADAECVAHIGAKPTGQTQNCTVAPQDRPLNCLSCGSIPHHGTDTRWAQSSTCGTACTSEIKTCNNGTIPPFSAGYIYTSQSTCPVTTCYTYSWKTFEYGACSATQCGTQGVQTRKVTCVRNDGATVSDSYCSGEKPSTTKTCSANSCTTPMAKGNSCYAFMGSSIKWTDSSTGKSCGGNLFGSLVQGDYMELGGSEIDPKTKWMIPWYKAKYKGAAKIICTNNSSGRPVFEVVSGSCKTEEPNFVASPKVGASTPSLCYASPVAQQAYGKGACAVYRQNASLDMPLKVIFFNNGIRKYPNPGEYAESFEQVYSATQGRLFTSAGVSITYKGETKNLNTFCGDYTATAKNNSTCSKSSSVVIGGVTFKIGVGARNTIDPKGYVPNYISGLPNSTKTEVWSQKTCGVVTLSSSLGYLPPPCP